MKYTAPDYYREFQCIASDCPATCCAGWQIVIDEKSLKKYKAYGGAFGRRLKASVNWRSGTFRQQAGRCAFLNQKNLCDIYTEAGPQMLCRTCSRYPRHVEEFDNEREFSLSLSCPAVARMLLARTKQVSFLEKQDEREEEMDDSFDCFLYSALSDCRKLMFCILQKRELDVRIRMGRVLALAHDVQNRIDARRIFEIEGLLERYGGEKAGTRLDGKLRRYCIRPDTGADDRTGGTAQGTQMQRMRKLLLLLDELETLDEMWPVSLRRYREALYGAGELEYEALRVRCRTQWNETASGYRRSESMGAAEPVSGWPDLESEQLMVYFLYVYLCGAVYDGDLLAKVKMAVAGTLILRELEYARQFFCDAPLTLEDRAQIVWSFSRELEHSDLNLTKMEELMDESPAAEFENLLYCIMNS